MRFNFGSLIRCVDDCFIEKLSFYNLEQLLLVFNNKYPFNKELTDKNCFLFANNLKPIPNTIRRVFCSFDNLEEIHTYYVTKIFKELNINKLENLKNRIRYLIISDPTIDTNNKIRLCRYDEKDFNYPIFLADALIYSLSVDNVVDDNNATQLEKELCVKEKNQCPICGNILYKYSSDSKRKVFRSNIVDINENYDEITDLRQFLNNRDINENRDNIVLICNTCATSFIKEKNDEIKKKIKKLEDDRITKMLENASWTELLKSRIKKS